MPSLGSAKEWGAEILKLTRLLNRPSPWVLSVSLLNLLLLSLYVLVTLSLCSLLIKDLWHWSGPLFWRELLVSLSLSFSAVFFSALLAVCFFYHHFFSTHAFNRLPAHAFLLLMARAPHILLGSLFLYWTILPVGVVSMGVLVLFITPRLYQFFVLQLWPREPAMIEMARSFSAPRSQIFFQFVMRPSWRAVLGRSFTLLVQGTCLVAPFFCLLSIQENPPWLAWQIFLSLDQPQGVNPSGFLMLLTLYTLAFACDQGQTSGDWRYG